MPDRLTDQSDPVNPLRAARGFTWPPRRPGPDVDAQARLVEVKPERPVEGPPKRSPLRLAQPATAQIAPSPAAIPIRSRFAQALADIEETWFDVTAPTLSERMLRENWAPDAIGDYCPCCALSVNPRELVDGRCKVCRSGEVARPPWERILRLGEYAPPLSRWICEVKFTRWRRLGFDLGRLLGQSLAEQIEAARAAGAIRDGPPLIVPVPMSTFRRMCRGIDHTMAIARGVAHATGGDIIQPLKRDHRPSQTLVAPSTRQANVANSVHARAAWLRPRLSGRLVVVVDDVTTTSSTLRASCRSIAACDRAERAGLEMSHKGKPAVIWTAVLARTPLDGVDRPDEQVHDA